MLRRLALLLSCALGCGGAFAVEVNEANQAQLEMVKGVGTTLSAQILEARTQQGPFKDWADLMARVKGLRAVRAAQLSSAGLTVNGAGMVSSGAGTVSADVPASAPR